MRKVICAAMVKGFAFVGLRVLLPGVDNAAHIGGLIAGLVIGFVIFRKIKRLEGLQGDERSGVTGS